MANLTQYSETVQSTASKTTLILVAVIKKLTPN